MLKIEHQACNNAELSSLYRTLQFKARVTILPQLYLLYSRGFSLVDHSDSFPSCTIYVACLAFRDIQAWRTYVKEFKNAESFLLHDDSSCSLARSHARPFARSLSCFPSGALGGETFTTGISVTAATRWRTDVWKTIIRNARCANPYNVQLRIYFRAFGSSSSPPSPPAAPVLHAARPAVPQWKPLELRKIDKSPAAEQFVYSAARLRANELERITYSYGLASSSFLLEIPAVDDPSPPRRRPSHTHLPSRGRGRWCSFRWYPPRVRTCLLYPFTARRPILSRELATFNRFLCSGDDYLSRDGSMPAAASDKNRARAVFLTQVRQGDRE